MKDESEDIIRISIEVIYKDGYSDSWDFVTDRSIKKAWKKVKKFFLDKENI